MKPFRILVHSAIIALFVATASAQRESPAGADARGAALLAGVNFRSGLAREIVAGKATAADGVRLLAGERNLMGWNFVPEFDYALAATDVGQRLIAAGKLAEAELFFFAAEKALTPAIENAREDGEKSDLLAQRAFLRANFLNKRAEARSDLEAASKLKPDDVWLKRKYEVANQAFDRKAAAKP